MTSSSEPLNVLPLTVFSGEHVYQYSVCKTSLFSFLALSKIQIYEIELTIRCTKLVAQPHVN